MSSRMIKKSMEKYNKKLDSLIDLHLFARLHVISYLSLVDAEHTRTCCRDLSDLIKEYFESTACLVPFNSTEEFVKHGMEKLYAPPTFGLVFYKRERQYNKEISKSPIMKDLPFVAVRSPEIQSVMGKNISSSTDLTGFVGCFPSPAMVVPFCVENNETSIKSRHVGLRVQRKSEEPDNPEVILLFTCGRPMFPVDTFCKEIQHLYPDATIIGGVCASGHVFDRWWEVNGNAEKKIKKISNGIFGLAMRGVPLRCVVSRGVESFVPANGSRAEITDFEYDPEENVIVLHSLKHKGKIMKPSEYAELMLTTQAESPMSSPLYIGLKLTDESGFRLHNFGSGTIAFHRGGECFLENSHGIKRKPRNKNNSYGVLEMYHITTDSTVKDLDKTMRLLRTQVSNAGEEIIGTIMISCSARGPGTGHNVPCRMMDATRFAKAFPGVPLCGFYAAGEIGPAALVDMDEGVYRRGDTQFQGFTAVFGLLAVPKRDRDFYKSLYNDE